MKKFIQPPYLKKGDKIGIVAPARKVSPEEMANAIKAFNEWGLEVVLGKNLYGHDNQYSGTDEERAADLQQMLDDKSVKAIISARGGYGSVRIIDTLDFTRFKKNPKWLIGYSDITLFHAHLHNMGFETLHATMPVNFKDNYNEQDSCEGLREAVFGKRLRYHINAHELNVKGNAEGVLVGGNLSIIYSLLGSVSDVDCKDKILFIEDIGEYLYHIDRMMISLKRAGKLNKIKGLLVGGFTDMNDNTIPFGKTPEQIIYEHAKALGIPVCFNMPVGHTPVNMPLIIGRTVKIKVGNAESEIKFM